jgi:hypothetical protein
MNFEDALTENWFYVTGDNASKVPDPSLRTVEATGTIHVLASNPSDREVRLVSARLSLRPPWPGIFDLDLRKFKDVKVAAWNVRVRNADGTLDDRALIPANASRDVLVDFSAEFVLSTLWNREVPMRMRGTLRLTDNWKKSSKVNVKVWRAGMIVWRRDD